VELPQVLEQLRHLLGKQDDVGAERRHHRDVITPSEDCIGIQCFRRGSPKLCCKRFMSYYITCSVDSLGIYRLYLCTCSDKLDFI